MQEKAHIRERSKAFRLMHLIPNLMTLGAVCAGMTSIRFAIEGNVAMSMSLIVLAAVLDGLDGALARALNSESAIGAELDSLADFVNFGVAPGLLLYLWALSDGRSGGWIAVLIYGVCCALRLARYNVSTRENPAAPKTTFTGVPAPGGALLVLFPLVLSRTFHGVIDVVLAYFSGVWLIAIGVLMISRMPTPSPKMLRVSREKAPLFMVGLLGFIAVFLTWPWPALLAVELGYIAVLIRFGLRRPARNIKEADE